MLTLKHLRTLRHVSILIDHHRDFVDASLKSMNFKKSLRFKILRSQSFPMYETVNVTHQLIHFQYNNILV